MEKLSKILTVNPLYYDALSGEFQPPTDSEGPKHTLGRLAVATFEKGCESELFPSFSGKEGLLNCSYNPSWAPDIKATAFYRNSADSRNSTLSGLWVEVEDYAVLSLSDDSVSDSPMLKIVEGGMRTKWDTRCLPLALGTDLNSTRDYVAFRAQNFFDNM